MRDQMTGKLLSFYVTPSLLRKKQEWQIVLDSDNASPLSIEIAKEQIDDIEAVLLQRQYDLSD